MLEQAIKRQVQPREHGVFAGGRSNAAWQTLQRLMTPIDGHLAWVLAVGSEQEQRQAIDALRPQRDRVLSALPA